MRTGFLRKMLWRRRGTVVRLSRVIAKRAAERIMRAAMLNNSPHPRMRDLVAEGRNEKQHRTSND
jgi:hypothetical protein